MNHDIYLLGGDRRMYYAARYLSQAGCICRTYQVPGLPDTFAPTGVVPIGAFLLLPFPAFREGFVTGTGCTLEMLLPLLQPGMTVLGGLLGSFQETARYAGAGVLILSDDSFLTVRNAALTAEGAISQAMSLMECALLGTECLIVGYGRIGSALAVRLDALHARVTASARNAADLAKIQSAGLCAEQTGQYRKPLSTYRCIFNTVPQPIFDEAQLAQFSDNCIYLELASAPGGILPQDVPVLGTRYHPAPGLPGRYAPESAGILYAEAVLRALEQEERWKI